MTLTAQHVTIYARYSSDNQRAASIDDQVELCRRHAVAQGCLVAAVYDDAAESGARRRSGGRTAMGLSSHRATGRRSSPGPATIESHAC